MSEHIHQWSVDHQLIFTDDGPPQPRGECFAYCGECGSELRWHEITDMINEYGPIINKLEAVKQVMYHSNDDTASRLAKALDIIRPVQQEQEDE